jgi:hypothetical protein
MRVGERVLGGVDGREAGGLGRDGQLIDGADGTEGVGRVHVVDG